MHTRKLSNIYNGTDMNAQKLGRTYSSNKLQRKYNASRVSYAAEKHRFPGMGVVTILKSVTVWKKQGINTRPGQGYRPAFKTSQGRLVSVVGNATIKTSIH